MNATETIGDAIGLLDGMVRERLEATRDPLYEVTLPEDARRALADLEALVQAAEALLTDLYDDGGPPLASETNLAAAVTRCKGDTT